MFRNLYPKIIAIIALISLSTAYIWAAPGGKLPNQKEIPMDPEKKPMKKDDLNKRLTGEQFHVTQENGTERPFNNAYWDNHEPGIYVDVVSGEPLFSSTDKFDSGTGWPSFTKPINKTGLNEIKDKSLGMERTEIRSRTSDSHLGHLFNDGPAPTGLRYCMNSAALRFIPTEKALFAAGCFWGVQAAFDKLNGVMRTTVGYSGGKLKNPTYEQVCAGNTGHAEAVEVEYDPKKLNYADLVQYFWRMHNPTTLNRQGPDIGEQYRSAIFTTNETQRKIALASKDELGRSEKWSKKIVTQIVQAGEFYPAEDYHQGYYKQHGIACHINP